MIRWRTTTLIDPVIAPVFPRAGAKATPKILGKMAGIGVPDAPHDLRDRVQRGLEKVTRTIHAETLQVAERRHADEPPEQMCEA